MISFPNALLSLLTLLCPSIHFKQDIIVHGRIHIAYQEIPIFFNEQLSWHKQLPWVILVLIGEAEELYRTCTNSCRGAYAEILLVLVISEIVQIFSKNANAYFVKAKRLT